MLKQVTIITDENLREFYSADVDVLEQIERGRVTAAVIIVHDLGEDGYGVEHAVFAEIPSMQDIANANVWEEDDADNVMEFLKERNLWEEK